MNKIDLAKKVVSTIVGMGTTKIVHQTIKNNTNPENVADTVTIAVASVAIGSMVVDATRAYTDQKIDEAVAWWNENITNRNQP